MEQSVRGVNMKKIDKQQEIADKAAEAIKLLTDASNSQLKIVVDAALNATKLLAQQALDASKLANAKGTEDHDLLIELKTEMKGIKEAVDKLLDRDHLYVLKEDFYWWRNLIVAGMLLTITIGVIMNLIK